MAGKTVTLPIFNRQGGQVGQYELHTDAIAPRINRQVLHDAVVMYEANQRVGTAKTKTRGEVAGSGKKMYRQKGTGHARMGTKRTGIRRGGGRGHATRPRDWSYRLPKKVVASATRMALLSKILERRVTLIDELAFEQPKTKEMAGILKALGFGDATCLVTTSGHDPTVWKSARNIEGLRMLPASDLNAYDILRPRRLLMTTAALDLLTAESKVRGV